ncbi:MAG: hemolysin family protein [Bdellovibrionota bacterium]
MISLLIITLMSLCVSFCCSMMEAALLTVPYAHVKHVAEQGSRAGKRLLTFKDDIRKPIAAILLLNTISLTLGSAVGGALVVQAFKTDSAVLAYSCAFTLLLLYGAEIPPKELGVVYCRTIALLMTYPLSLLIKFFYPFIWFSEWLSKHVGAEENEPSVSLAEVLSVAKIGSEEGVLDRLEGSVIRNIIGLDRRLVKDVLTPRVVVFRLDEAMSVNDVAEDILTWNHTRIPLFPEDEPDRIERYVLQRDVFRALVRGQREVPLRDLARPLTTISSLMRADKLLLQMFEKREHICAVVDEHGGFAGIVTLEDIIEEIVGREIVDESDLVSDLRSYARSIYARRGKK